MKIRIATRYWETNDQEYWKQNVITLMFFPAILAVGNVIWHMIYDGSMNMMIINGFMIALFLLMMRSKTKYDERKNPRKPRGNTKGPSTNKDTSETNQNTVQEIQDTTKKTL